MPDQARRRMAKPARIVSKQSADASCETQACVKGRSKPGLVHCLEELLACYYFRI